MNAISQELAARPASRTPHLDELSTWWMDCLNAQLAALELIDENLPEVDGNPEWLRVASEEFNRRIEQFWPPPPKVAEIGAFAFGRISAFALDDLSRYLREFLPAGNVHTHESGSIGWLAQTDRGAVFVNGINGSWDAPDAGRSGRDLISLTAFLDSSKQSAAALKLAAWAGVEARRHG